MNIQEFKQIFIDAVASGQKMEQASWENFTGNLSHNPWKPGDEFAKAYNPVSKSEQVITDAWGPIPYIFDICHSFDSIFPQVDKDLSKVKFDFENFESYYQPNYDMDPELMGFQNWAAKPFLGCYAGGDWEFPIYFIIYHDGANLRGFIPENGNFYNHIEMTAFGNNDDSDEIEAQRQNFDPENDFFNWDLLKDEVKAKLLE